MSSSYTTRLGLELQADGENSNTWGQRTNNSVISLLDAAIAGITSVALSSAPITLTDNDGAADQARSAILYLHGVLTSNCQIVVPSVQKSYLVWNGCTGNFNPVVKTAGGEGSTIPRGGMSQVFCDTVSVWVDGTSIGNALFTAADASVARAAIGASAITSIAVSAGVGVSVTGSPLTGAGSIGVALDINKLTAETSVVGSADYVPLYDASEGAVNKATPDVLARGWVLVSAADASNSANIDFTGLDDTYDNYLIVFNNVIPATNAANFDLRVATSASGFITSSGNYNWVHSYLTYTSSSPVISNSVLTGATNRIVISQAAQGVSNLAAHAFDGEIRFNNPESPNSTWANFSFNTYMVGGINGLPMWGNGGGQSISSPITGVRLSFASGNISRGTFRLYGLKKTM
jgi:hypothetical protein